MKKLIYILIVFLFATPVFAAPIIQYFNNISPFIDNTYSLGDVTHNWANLYTKQICLSSDCKTAWPTSGGGSGGGTWSTTTSNTAGQLINYPNNTTDIVNIGSNSTTTGKFWFDPNANLAIITSGKLGIGTTTPFGLLSVNPDGNGSGVPEFVVGSSTINHFIIDGGGNVGIGVPKVPNLTTLYVKRNQSATILNLNDTFARSALSVLGSVSTGIQLNFGQIAASAGGGFSLQVTDSSAGTSASALALNPFGGNVGVGTTSPWGNLSVNPKALGSGVPGFVVGSSTATQFVVKDNGNVGIGLPSPNATFYVNGESGAQATFSKVGSSVFASNSHTAIISSAITGNLFEGYGGASGNTLNASLTNGGSLGLGTSSPYARLSVTGTGATSASASLLVSDSTDNPILFVRNDGSLGIGTTTLVAGGVMVTEARTNTFTSATRILHSITQTLEPASNSSATYQPLVVSLTTNANVNYTGTLTGLNALVSHTNTGIATSVIGGIYIAQNTGTGTSTTVTSVSATPKNTGTGVVVNMNGLSVVPTNSGGGTVTTFTGVNVPSTSIATNNYSALFGDDVGFGTTTPMNPVTAFSSSQPQIALTAGGNLAQWTMRNAGANFYLSTSTVAGNATSTQISPFELRNDGTAYMPFTTTSGASQTGYWCYDTNGQLIRDTAVCIVSARKFKTNIKALDLGLSDLMKIDFVSYYKKDPLSLEDSHKQIGVIADDVAKINPELNEALVTYVGGGTSGEVHAFRYEQFTALLGQSIKDLNKKVEALPQYASEAKRDVEENWQWFVIGLLALGFIYQQIEIYKLKNK